MHERRAGITARQMELQGETNTKFVFAFNANANELHVVLGWQNSQRGMMRHSHAVAVWTWDEPLSPPTTCELRVASAQRSARRAGSGWARQPRAAAPAHASSHASTETTNPQRPHRESAAARPAPWRGAARGCSCRTACPLKWHGAGWRGAACRRADPAQSGTLQGGERRGPRGGGWCGGAGLVYVRCAAVVLGALRARRRAGTAFHLQHVSAGYRHALTGTSAPLPPQAPGCERVAHSLTWPG